MAAPIDWVPYCGAAPSPAEWLGRWNTDPALLLAGALLAAATLRLGGRARSRPIAAWAALVLLAVLFVSPFCALTSALFSARVVHHVLVSAVVAPLIVAALPASGNPRKLAGSLAVWTAAQAIVFWAWHAPPLYAVALRHDAVYWLMQASLLAAAAGFWSAVRGAAAPAAAAALLATMVQMGLLGALLGFSANAWYVPHFASTVPWGFSPLEDQQLAGLVMSAPAAGLYLAAALAIMGRWLAREARPAPRSA